METNAQISKSHNPVLNKLRLNDKSKVKKVIGVLSGKGGVGKSFVSSSLAVHAAKLGKRVAILDADITGASIPKSFGIHENALQSDGLILPAISKSGIQIMSVGLLLENETDPVIWRGPVISGVMSQFYTDVYWNDVDIMFVDMPPGTGDVTLTAFQSFPLDGIIIVSTPGDLVSLIVEKQVNMAKKMNIKILGLIENMSYFITPDTRKKYEIFGKSRLNEFSEKLQISALGCLPIDPKAKELVDAGRVEDYYNIDIEKIVKKII